MLTITPDQLATLTREHMLDKLLAFLRERTREPAVVALLAVPHACRDFWTPLYDRLAGADEHAVAVRLSYALAARAHGGEPRLATVAGDDAEVAMKSRLEQWRVLPFAAFDA